MVYLSILRLPKNQLVLMEKKLTKYFFILTLCLAPFSIISQEDGYINGQLLDAKTREPIVFASIHLKNRSVGVISNLDGGFKIPTLYRDLGDILVISSMGYQKQELLISDLSIYEINMIRLQPSVFELTEALITAKKKRKRELSANQIVRKAIKAIPENYPIKPFSTVGYYRDYQIEKEKYVNLNEAILEVFDLGFNQIDTATTKTRIYNYIQNNKFRRDTLSDKPYNYKKGNKIIEKAFLSGYGGNEFTILKVHDAIRNYELNTFDFINGLKDRDILKNHSLKRVSDTSLDDKLLYVVALNRNKNGYGAKGVLYISKNDFAIHKLEYAVYDNTKRNNNEKLREEGIRSKLIFKITTEYKRGLNDIMYLNYISFHNAFQLRQPPKFTLKSIEVNINQKYFVLNFNNKLNSENALSYSNYKGFFQGKNIKFDRLVLLENKVYLYSKSKTKKQEALWQQLKATGVEKAFKEKLLYFNVKNIKDVDDNFINEWYSKDYDQFREFFVQEIKLNPQAPKDSLFMDKHQPIFKHQPILKPDNFSDYWMNTPLQNIEN